MNDILQKQYKDYVNNLKINGYLIPNGWNDLTTTATTAAVPSHYGYEAYKIKYLQLGNFKLAIKKLWE